MSVKKKKSYIRLRPEVHVGAAGIEGVVDEHAAVGDPQGGEDEDDAGQHLHDLKFKGRLHSRFRLRLRRRKQNLLPGNTN